MERKQSCCIFSVSLFPLGSFPFLSQSDSGSHTGTQAGRQAILPSARPSTRQSFAIEGSFFFRYLFLNVPLPADPPQTQTTNEHVQERNVKEPINNQQVHPMHCDWAIL